MDRKSFIKNLLFIPAAAVGTIAATQVVASDNKKEKESKIILIEKNRLSKADRKNIRNWPYLNLDDDDFKDYTVYLDFTTGEWTQKRNK